MSTHILCNKLNEFTRHTTIVMAKLHTHFHSLWFSYSFHYSIGWLTGWMAAFFPMFSIFLSKCKCPSWMQREGKRESERDRERKRRKELNRMQNYLTIALRSWMNSVSFGFSLSRWDHVLEQMLCMRFTINDCSQNERIQNTQF